MIILINSVYWSVVIILHLNSSGMNDPQQNLNNKPSLMRSSFLSFDSLRKTTNSKDYDIKGEEDFLIFYKTDPFFKARIDYKLGEI